MEKINFVNNSQPALNGTNLNKLQDNVEDAIEDAKGEIETIQDEKVKNSYTTGNINTYSCDYINKINEYNIHDDQERIIGTHFGKPLYRKEMFINKTINVNSWTVFNYSELGISNIDFMRVRDVILYRASNIKESVFSNNTRIQILSYGLSILDNTTSSRQYFMLEYTKTTD